MENPFRLEIFDKTFTMQAIIGDPQSLSFTIRHNQKSTGQVMVPGDHPKMEYLTADGARYMLWYEGELLSSGKITLRQENGPSIKSVATLQLADDFRKLYDILGWPAPSSPIDQQGATDSYYTVTGDAETVVKDLVQKNMVDRLAMPVVCAANQHRGATIPGGVSVRFHPLVERLFPAVDEAGIGVTFRQSGSQIICDVYEPATFHTTLTEQGGMVRDWAWSAADPTNTRVIAGGEGEGTARDFTIATEAARETAQADIIEVFRDARDAKTPAVLADRAQETLDEGAALGGFSLDLAETENFRYGAAGVHVGDRVTVRIGAAQRTDVLRSATLSWSIDKGRTVTPVVGEVKDNPQARFAKFLARLRKSINNLEVSR